MHNRARMVTASFLTRNLGIDWRHGLAHFDSLLADGDVANNAGNWQWVAGTGNNTRPNRGTRARGSSWLDLRSACLSGRRRQHGVDDVHGGVGSLDVAADHVGL